MDSAWLSAGKMVDIRIASMLFPHPGEPQKIKLCPPAAAISSALLGISCPLTSQRSTLEQCAGQSSSGMPLGFAPTEP